MTLRPRGGRHKTRRCAGRSRAGPQCHRTMNEPSCRSRSSVPPRGSSPRRTVRRAKPDHRTRRVECSASDDCRPAPPFRPPLHLPFPTPSPRLRLARGRPSAPPPRGEADPLEAAYDPPTVGTASRRIVSPWRSPVPRGTRRRARRAGAADRTEPAPSAAGWSTRTARGLAARRCSSSRRPSPPRAAATAPILLDQVCRAERRRSTSACWASGPTRPA